MAAPNDTVSMALYCDFENVALGVRDANYDKFDIKPILERLLLKGSIVVKKAYCDWERYKEFKAQMHEASFELIEIPHVRQSGKNSADIRLVVDALDLCYTKSHVNTFVIISGDSDFSPLVSKLRENARYVIGVGVKNSTSDLLVANCDEFIFIDDLVRESRRTAATREKRQAPAAARPTPDDERRPKMELEARKTKAIEMAAETFDALMLERGDSGKIWASALKQAIKRRKPDFNETYFGFRTFGNLLEEAAARGLLEIGRDDKSGAFVYRSTRNGSGDEMAASVPALVAVAAEAPAGSPSAGAVTGGKNAGRRGGRNARSSPAMGRKANPNFDADGNREANGNYEADGNRDTSRQHEADGNREANGNQESQGDHDANGNRDVDGNRGKSRLPVDGDSALRDMPEDFPPGSESSVQLTLPPASESASVPGAPIMPAAEAPVSAATEGAPESSDTLARPEPQDDANLEMPAAQETATGEARAEKPRRPARTAGRRAAAERARPPVTVTESEVSDSAPVSETVPDAIPAAPEAARKPARRPRSAAGAGRAAKKAIPGAE